MTSLIAETRPEVQEQIKKVYNFYRVAAVDDLKKPCEALEEIQRLRDITDDKGEIIQQLAIFVATTESVEDLHSMVAGDLLERLRLPASIPIRVLAPYLNAENEKLRDFAYGWFHNHDSYDRIHGHPPFGSVNYYDYMVYVRSRVAKNEEIPAGFIKFIYERHPGKALLVFAYASRAGDAVAQLHDIRKSLDAARQALEPTAEEIRQRQATKRQHTIQRQEAKIERSEILLAEHIVSNAIWLKQNDFAERLQAALPEAKEQLLKLARHREWWARLYVVYILRQNPELRQADIMQQLANDENELVNKAAKSAE